VIKSFSLYLALRYLRPKRTFVSVITLISVLGVTLGVGVLIVVIAVMAGFHAQMKDLAIGYEAHIEARDAWGTSMFGDGQRPPDAVDKPWREVLKDIRANPEVVSASPMVRGLLLVESEAGMAPAWMWGLDQEDGNRMIEKQKELLHEGAIDLGGNNIVIDKGLADFWQLRVGDSVTVYAPSNLKNIVETVREIDNKPEEEKQAAYSQLKELTLPEELTIVGIINPPQFQDSDKMNIAVIPLHLAQEMRGLQDGISSIGIELKEPYQASTVKAALFDSKAMPHTWEAFTWMEAHSRLFAAVQNEMMMMYVILFIIVLVAAFCVMNTMITVTVQKRREIGIISALGSRIGQIMWVFLWQGMFVGATGAICGLGAGLAIANNLNTIRGWINHYLKVDLFDANIYGLIELPARVLPMDVAIICGGAFVLCTLAALVPAFLAGRTEPAVALRD
jgi:lipoprotein-releasing system permease protein